MKNIGLLLSSVAVIECCVMTSEVRAVIPKTRLGEIERIIEEAGKRGKFSSLVPIVGHFVNQSEKSRNLFLIFDLDKSFEVAEGKDLNLFDARAEKVRSVCRAGKIYFPIDGCQPTTEDAAEYSGAKIAVACSDKNRKADKMGEVAGLFKQRLANMLRDPIGCDKEFESSDDILSSEAKEELNKKITSWYMYVFGGKDVEPYVDVKIAADDAVFPKFAPDGRNIINFNNKDIANHTEKWKKDQRELIKNINKQLGGDEEKQEEQLKKQIEDFDKKFDQFDIEDFKRVFWTRFKTIASDPVGRILLYRLLIEIWRTYDGDHSGISNKNGAVEHFEGDEASYFMTEIPIKIGEKRLAMNVRNACRSLNIWIGNGGGFGLVQACIRINPNHNSSPTVVKKVQVDEDDVKELQIRQEEYPADVSLYHEMLHWLHFLRNPIRCVKMSTRIDKSFDRSPYAHIFECYYGIESPRALALYPWRDKNDRYLEGEEVCTILGTPDESKGYFNLPKFKLSQEQKEKRKKFEWKRNNNFLNGDDLSENAYRLSRTSPDMEINMRFGHDKTEAETHLAKSRGLEVTGGDFRYNPIIFKVAHDVATKCYKDITGVDKDWRTLQNGKKTLKVDVSYAGF